jgi:hypothetical protein
VSKTKPETVTVDLTYDELEAALTALALRQEELRGARSRHYRLELEMIWNVSDKLDLAQRNLEDRLSTQMEGWLRSVTEHDPRPAPAREARGVRRNREGLLTRLSRLVRL